MSDEIGGVSGGAGHSTFAEPVLSPPDEGTGSCILRVATPADFSPLSDAIDAACDELEEKFGTGNASDALKNIAGQNMEHIFLTILDDEIVGYIMWVPSSQKGEVVGAGTWVDEDCRGQQISRRLREMAISHWRSLGGKVVTGTVSVNNEAGIASLKRYGCEPVGLEVRKIL